MNTNVLNNSNWLENLIKNEKILAELFLNHLLKNQTSEKILISDWNNFQLKKRIELNKNYLNEVYDFLKKNENIKILNDLCFHFEIFETKFKNFKHHKNAIKTQKINLFFEIDDAIEKSNILTNNYLKYLFIISLFISLLELQVETEIIFSKKIEENSNIFIENKLNYDPHSLENSKWDLINLVEKIFKNRLLILNELNLITFNVSDLTTFILYFLSFLLASNFFVNNSKKIVKNKQISYKTIYNFTINNYNYNLPEFIFYLEFCQYEPIILKIKNNNSLNNKKITYIQFFDIIFKSQIINRKNNHYCSYDSFKKEKIEYYSEQYNKYFDLTLKKTNNTKIYIDKEDFINISKDFIINNICKDGSITWNSEFNDLIKYFKNYSLIKATSNKILFINILQLIFLKKLEIKIKNQNYLFFPFHYDFRGRKYYNSMISPTNFILTRFFIYFGYYSKEELDFIINKTNHTKSLSLLKQFFTHINDNKDRFKLFKTDELDLKKEKNYNFIITIIINTLISIGVVFKSEILKKQNYNTNNDLITINQFFQYGFNYYLNNNFTSFNNFDIEDQLKLKLYFKILNNEISIYKKKSVCYDFSCSGHQLNYLYSIFKDPINFKKINIDGIDVYCDLYTYFITLFKNIFKNLFKNEINTDFKEFCSLNLIKKNKNNKIIPINKKKFISNYLRKYNFDLTTSNSDEIMKNWITIELKKNFTDDKLNKVLDLFTRKYLKKSIMTTQYNVSLLSFLDYYENSLNSTHDKTISIEFAKEIKILLKYFYFFCNNLEKFHNFDTLISKDQIHIILEKSNYTLEFFDNFKVVFAFFKKSEKDVRETYYFDVENNLTKRLTTSLLIMSKQVDKDKTILSLYPNYIHSLDAGLIRLTMFYLNKFLNTCDCLTIHDEYWIPYQNSLIFKDLMNNLIKINLNNKFNLEDIKDIDDFSSDLLIDEKLKFFYNFFVIL